MAAGDAWVEIWSRPGSAVFERLDINVPGNANFTKRMAGGIGEGNISVPADWPSINSVIKRVPGTPASDVRTLNRAFIEQVTGAALVKYEWFNDLTDDETDEVDLQIKGPGIESIMADGIVYPWDWDGLDESTSTFPDWIWGGKDIVGPVEVSFIPHIFKVWNLATGGTLDIDVSINGGAFQSATVNHNASAFTVETAIEALSNVTTAEVQGAGTAQNPWEIRIIAPAGTYTTAVDGSSLTGPIPRAFIELDQFGKLIPIGWTTSRVGATDIEHGVVTDFRASLGGGSDPVLPAGCDAWVVFLGQEYLFPGVQKRVRVTPGGIYQVGDEMILYAQGAAATLRVVIRDLNENFIAAEEITLVSNTPTNIAGLVNVMIPAGITEVVFRIGHIGAGTPPRIFIACPNMREGLAPTTAGGIIDALFDDATVNHVADGRVVWENLASVGTSYIDLSFTVAVDSDGVTWDEPELTFTAQRGKTYLQVLTDLNHIGYKWTVTPSVTPGRWNLNLYNPTWIDTDATALSTPAINVGSGVTSGPIYRSHLTGNVMTVEGAQMQFGRAESTTSIASIGRREVYQPDRSLMSSAMVTLRAAEEVTARLLSGLAVSVNVDPVDAPIPLLDYDVDWLINVQIPPILTKSAHRLASITVNIGETTTYQLSFSSEAFAGVQGALEAVRRLMLKFNGLDRTPPDAVDTPIIGGGSAPTVVVAAVDSTQYSKGRADFICTGTNDEGTIQFALNICALTGGIVWLCEGNYSLFIPTTDAAIVVPAGVVLQGVGHGMNGVGASLESQNASDPGRLALIRMRGHSEVHNLTLYPFDSALGIQLTDLEGFMKITDCWIETQNSACIEGEESNEVWIERNMLWVSDDPATEDDSCIHIHTAGIVDLWISRNWMLNGWHGIFLDGDQGRNFILDNYISQSWFSGIRLKNDDNPIFATVVSRNVISTPGVGSDGSTGEAGIYITMDGADINPTQAQSNGLIIADNPIEIAATCHGIRLTDCVLVNVHDNYIEQQGLHGIYLQDANGCQIHDNIIQEPNTFPDTTYDGIHLVTSDDNYIRFNTIVEHTGGSPSTYRYGINISDTASDRNAVLFNDLRMAGGGTDFFNDASATTVIDPPAGAPYGSNLT